MGSSGDVRESPSQLPQTIAMVGCFDLSSTTTHFEDKTRKEKENIARGRGIRRQNEIHEPGQKGVGRA